MAAGKGILALLASSPKGKGGSSEPSAPMGEASSGGESEGAAALRDMWQLLKGGDYEGAWSAFQTAKSCCDDDMGGEDEDDDMPLSGDGEDFAE